MSVRRETGAVRRGASTLALLAACAGLPPSLGRLASGALDASVPTVDFDAAGAPTLRVVRGAAARRLGLDGDRDRAAYLRRRLPARGDLVVALDTAPRDAPVCFVVGDPAASLRDAELLASASFRRGARARAKSGPEGDALRMAASDAATLRAACGAPPHGRFLIVDFDAPFLAPPEAAAAAIAVCPTARLWDVREAPR
ncbi:MAG TPA: hypothetical protein VEI02_05725 [Planctomycetota bacterium]|nr:hypothetical protein [Planctomycetota bacterium]